MNAGAIRAQSTVAASRLLAAPVFLTAALLAEPASAQQPDVALPGVELDSVAGFTAGAAGALVFLRGEAFRRAGTGYGLEVFLGVRWTVVDELRVGASLSRHDDPEFEEDLAFRALFLDVYWAWELGRARLRGAPRIAWGDVAGEGDRALRGFGVGGTVGPQIRFSDRWRLDSGLWLTMLTLPRPPDSPDPDRVAYGTVWGIRIGVAFGQSDR